MGFSMKIEFAGCIFDKLYHRANPRSGFRPIVCFAVELQRFLCNRATPPTIEKLRSESVAMHAYGISVYYVYTGSQLNGPGWSHSKSTQRSSEDRILSSITRAASSSMPKKLKRLMNVRQFDKSSCTLIARVRELPQQRSPYTAAVQSRQIE